MVTRDLFAVINFLVIARQQRLARRARYCFTISLRPSVCLSVRLSVTLRYCMYRNAYVVKVSGPSGSFLAPTAITKLQGEPLSLVIKCTAYVKNFVSLTEIAAYCRNGTR